MPETLHAEVNTNVQTDKDNKAVASALDLIAKNFIIREEREQQWSAIQELFEKGFEISSPDGVRHIESQLLHQAIRSVVQKMKVLDVSVHSSTADPMIEKVVTDGLGSVLEEGGYNNVMRDKFGVFYRIALFGDAFVRVGTDKDQDYPIRFQNSSLLNIYVDPFATQMRSPTSEKDCDELVAIYKYSWDEAIEIYPELEDIGGAGTIPRAERDEKDFDFTYNQDLETEDREVEIAHYYNMSKKNYTIFAGKACTVIREFNGDDYPFMKGKQPFIPFLHFMFDPGTEGFYNYGLGHILYKLAILTRRLDNMGINYGYDNISPISMVNLPKGEKARFFNRLINAQQAQAQGKKAFIVNEYSSLDPNGQLPQLTNFRNEPLTQEWERLFNRLDLMIKRMGINLDSVDRGATTTATQIIAEEENQDAFVKQVMEQNAGEFKFVWELTIEMIKKSITKNNKTLINQTSRLNLGNQEVEIRGVTLGDLSDELRKNKYFIKVNARSGAIPSNVLRQAQLSRALQVVSPEDPLFNVLRAEFIRLNDLDLPQGALAGAQLPQQGQQSQDISQKKLEEAGQPLPTETDELAVQTGAQLQQAPRPAIS